MSTNIHLLRRTENGGYRLETFRRRDAPSYAILSHTWSKDQSDEVTFQDIRRGSAHFRKAFPKLTFCDQQARRDRLDYFWIDTCCIDKGNEVEEKSTVSLMWQIYEAAEKCYALLSDVLSGSAQSDESSAGWEEAMKTSRWFARGWTLQELLAPRVVEFYSHEGDKLGDKSTLKELIHGITGISIGALEGQEMSNFGIEERLRWARDRETTREEDQSYSLFGLFGISMEISYGEGKEIARARLLAEVEDRCVVRNDAGSAGRNQRPQQIPDRDPLLEWLSALDFATSQADMIARRHEGTGHNFISSPEFEHWKSGRSKTLLFAGIPGAGKTMTAAIAIEHLTTRTRPDIGVAWAFCNYRSHASQGASALLAALLRQLVEGRPDLTDVVKSLHERHEERKSRPLRDEIVSALTQVCSALTRVYIVVDALDECSEQYGERSRLIEQLRRLQTRADVQVLYTCRPITEIVEQVKADLKLEVRTSEDDIRRYVGGQLGRMPRFIQQDAELQRSIADGVVEAAEGMFLLVRLHCDAIAGKSTETEVRSVIAKLRSGAEGLDAAYNDALQRIDRQLQAHRLLGRRAISWVTHSRRPLLALELCHALEIKGGNGQAESEVDLQIGDVLTACAGLLVVDEESQIVRLVHYTTQEYLERVRGQWLPEAEMQTAEACLTYLSYDAFRAGSCGSDEEYEQRLADYPLFEYCGRHWGKHVRGVQGQDEVLEQTVELLQVPEIVDSMTQASVDRSYRFGGYTHRFPRQTTGLHLAAREGLEEVVQGLLATSDSIKADPKDSDGRTPLSWAAARGHEGVVQLLAGRDDVDADSKDRYGQTPLSLAAVEGYEGVVQLLAGRDDVDADSKDIIGRTSLSWAAARGHEGVVKLLAGRDDVDISWKDRYGQTPLSLAAEEGHEGVVKLLVERDDVDADPKDSDGRTPLSLAAEEGHEGVVQLLTGRDDVDTDSKDSDGRTPLSRAAEEGHEGVVQILIGRDDVDVNSKDGNGQTPLSWAAGGGHEGVVKLLVERGDVDADLKDSDGRTPLSWAAEEGHEGVVHVLVGRDDVDVNSKDSDGQTPLSRAAARGHEEVVKLLKASKARYSKRERFAQFKFTFRQRLRQAKYALAP